jgi:hypothetical protein
MANSPEPKQSQLFEGDARGTDLLKGANATAVMQLIREFVNR